MQKTILFTILTAIFVVFVGIGIIVPILPIYAAEFGATGFSLGVIVAGFPLSAGLLQPFVGNLSDRHGRKGFLVSGLIIFSLTGYIYTLAGSVVHLVMIRILHGAGSALVFPIAMAYITDVAAGKNIGRYMGMYNIAIFSGIGAGPVLGGFFLDLLGRNSAFHAMALLSLISTVLVAAVLPGRDLFTVAETPERFFTVFRRMLRNQRLKGILLARMSTMIIIVPTFAFLPLLMTRQMSASGSEIGMVIACRTLVNAVFQVPFGKLADHWNQNRLLLAGSTIISTGIFFVPFAVSFVPLLLLFGLIGLGEAVSWPAMGAMAAEEGQKYGQGSMMGAFNMAMNMGLFIGAMGVGALVDLLGISWAFYTVALFLFFCAVAAAAMIRNSRCGKAFDLRSKTS